jgi:hypothetical protein
VSVASLQRVGVAGGEANALWQQSVEAGIQFDADLSSLSDRYLLRYHLAEVLTAVLEPQGHIGTYGDGHRQRSFVAERSPVGRVGDGEQRNEFLELLQYLR